MALNGRSTQHLEISLFVEGPSTDQRRKIEIRIFPGAKNLRRSGIGGSGLLICAN